MSFPISPTGAWLCDTSEPHSFDEPLATELVNIFKDAWATTILDVGCGAGGYVRYLRAAGFRVDGIDGNPRTPEFCDGCKAVELTEGFSHLRASWVLCLEVGEHIPSIHEAKFLDDICSASEAGVVLSWFPTDGEGIGHVNPRSNEHVKQEMARRGLRYLPGFSARLRNAATCWWFKHSLMVFTR